MVKLDWDIEAEPGKHQAHQENPDDRRNRYRGLMRLLMLLAGLLLSVGLVWFLVQQRLNQVDSRLESLLIDTVKSEVASLRIGDFDTYMDIQRSATDSWLIAQEQTFQTYQDLKASAEVTLSGRVVDTEINGQRGRVIVEEIVDRVPYHRVWFYWRYSDVVQVNEEGDEIIIEGGWRHVPPDYTFWGESRTLEREGITVRYDAVDSDTAEGVTSALAAWRDLICNTLSCDVLPSLTVDIAPQPGTVMRWADDAESSGWRLLLPSPYTNRARADQPFDPQMRGSAATLLAERLTDNLMTASTVSYPQDAYYLREAALSWWVAQFTEQQTQSYLIDSLVTNYGGESLAQLLRSLQPTSNIGILGTVIDAPTLADANLNWQDFILYRLQTEAQLIQAQDENAWRQLYHFRDATVESTAYARFSSGIAPSAYQIQAINRATYPDDSPQLQVRVQVVENNQTLERIIVFDLVNNTWLRAN